MAEEKKRRKRKVIRNNHKPAEVTEAVVTSDISPQTAEVKPESKPEITPAVITEKPPAVRPKVTKKYTRRTVMIALGGCMSVIGLGGLILYFFTQNLIIGFPGIGLALAGFILAKVFWDKQQESFTVEKFGEVPKKQVNCLNIYWDYVEFADVDNPTGYPQTCLNDKQKYWVNFFPLKKMAPNNTCTPFMLPDQQYYDPVVFAERVLELPAHRKIFKRKEKLGQHIKTALLVASMVVIMILIVVTTGN